MKKLLLLLPIALFMYAKPVLDADYDRGLDLVIIEDNTGSWYYTRFPEQLEYEAPTGYLGLFWDGESNYYMSRHYPSLIHTNGLSYKYDPTKEETYFFPGTTEKYIGLILYVGSISPLERVYIDAKDTNVQYIKILTKIETSEPLYPTFLRKNYRKIFTNKSGKEFFLIYNREGDNKAYFTDDLD